MHVMKLVGGRPNSMLVLSVVTWLATAGPQTASAYYICHSGHLKLLAEAPKARRAAAMGVASCACIMCIVQACEPERKKNAVKNNLDMFHNTTKRFGAFSYLR